MYDVRLWISFGFAGAVILALAMAGVTQALGAHPFWDVKIVFFGLLPALIATLLLARNAMAGAAITALATVLAYGAARWGKTEFAASFAENALAGQFWYFGWIVTAGAAVAALALLGLAIWRGRG